MFAIQSSSKGVDKCTPNLLPCRINHNGPIEANARYWKPEHDDDNGKSTAYFRGRKLLGREVTLPDGYQGAILRKTDRLAPTQQMDMPPADLGDTEAEEVDDPPDEIKIAEVSKTFEKFIVWGHDSLPDATSDPHIKGVQEWIAFAQKMHGHPTESSKPNGEPQT